MKGLIRFSYGITILSSLIFIVFIVVIGYFGLFPFEVDNYILFNIGISILAASLLFLRQFILQGLNHTSNSQIVNSMVRYVFVLILLGNFIFVFSVSINTAEAVFVNTISLVTSLILIELIFKKVKPKELQSMVPVYSSEIWIRSALLLFAYKLMTTFLLNSEILFLGFLREDKETGIYSVARKISGFVSFGLFASNIVLAPKIASMYSEGKFGLLQNLVRKSIRIIFIFSLIVTLVLVIISYPIFTHLGDEYQNSLTPLLIMMAGELINVAFGPVATILIGSNQEKEANKIMFVSLAFNLLSNVLLIYYFGYIGAAISTAMSVVLWNVLMAIAVKNKIGIKSWIW